MGETSLARQLKKLATPQTSLLLQDKFRPSLLFDPKEAAALDRETIYAIGVTGLEELQDIQGKFAEFQNTLFDSSSKMLERAVLTAEVNRKLDRAISHFLTTVSPYFLLRPAHKALEWLIHRFHIHNYNIDEFIACILPYHETRIFARAIQLLDVKDTACKWHWLHPLQKPGIPLPKFTLLNHCSKDLGFMRFVCDLVPNSLKVYGNRSASVLQTTISFYVITIVGSLEVASPITEQHVALLLPYLKSGIASPVLDYRAGTYMILCQLYRKTNIAATVSETLLINIAKNLGPEQFTEGIMCILIICQQQKLKSLPPKMVELLCKFPQIVETLENMSAKYKISSLLQPLLKTLIHLARNNEQDNLHDTDENITPSKLLHSLIQTVPLVQDDVLCCVKTTFDVYFELKSDLKCQSKLGLILAQLERRFPDSFDWSIEQCSQHCSTDKSKALHYLLNATLPAISKHKMLTTCNTSIFLAVNHANKTVRKMAVRMLVKKLKKEKKIDKKFASSSILARLADDVPSIVTHILSLNNLLLKIVPTEDLFPALKHIVTTSHSKNKKKWFLAKESALHLLCNKSFFPKDDCQSQCLFLVTILPYLFPLHIRGVKLSQMILSSTLAKKNPFLKDVWKGCSDQDSVKDVAHFGLYVLLTISNNIKELASSNRTDLVLGFFEAITETNGFLEKFLTCCLLYLCIPKISDDKLRLKCAQLGVTFCFNLLKTEKMRLMIQGSAEDTSDLLICTLKLLRKRHFPQDATIFALRNILKALHIPRSQTEAIWWHNTTEDADANSAYNLQVELFDFLTENQAHLPVFQALLKNFFELYFKEKTFLTRFLSSLWTIHCDIASTNTSLVTPVLQARALNIGNVLISQISDPDWLENKSDPVIPSVLISLMSPNQPIRHLSLNILDTMRKKKCEPSLSALIAAILTHKEEVLADPNQLALVFQKWCSKASFPKKGSSSAQVNFFLEHLLNLVADSKTPYHIKYGLLTVMKEANSQHILSFLSSVLSTELSKDETCTLSHIQAECIKLLLIKFSAETASFLPSEQHIYESLESALRSETKIENNNSTVQKLALKVVTKQFFFAIPCEKTKLALLKVLLDVCIGSSCASTCSKATSVVKKLLSDGHLVSKELQEVDENVPKSSIKGFRGLRLNESSLNRNKNLENAAWKRVVTLLEILQSKKHVDHCEQVVPICFRILRLSLEMEKSSSSEYLRQVILSCLLNLCQQLNSDPGLSGPRLGAEHFRVELVVQCIRASHRPQTHNLALMLLNVAASLFPEYILHNVMAIFTFMGASLVKQDDQYSFQVILDTVQTIIPALLQASHENQYKGKAQEIISAAMLVFVDALPDIPEHRRIPLFVAVLSNLGVKQYLWECTAQILEKCATRRKSEASVGKDVNLALKGGLPPLAEFAVRLVHKFSPEKQILTLLNLAEYLMCFPLMKSDNESQEQELPKQFAHKVLTFKRLTTEDIEHFACLIVNFIIAVITSQVYVAQVAQLDSSKMQSLDNLYRRMLEATLKCIQNASHINQIDATPDESSSKFWKVLLPQLYALLDKVNSLLPSDRFIAVVSGLIEHPSSSVKRKAMEMLSTKLVQQSGFFSANDVNALLGLISPLLKIVKRGKEFGDGDSAPGDQEEAALNRQTALFCLKVLCKRLGSTHQEEFKFVLQAVVKLLQKDLQPYLMSGAFLCLSELCNSLGAHTIPFLPKFMPRLCEMLESTEQVQSNELLLLSVVTAAHRLVDRLPSFLSAYMDTLIKQTCTLSSCYPSSADNPLSQRLRKIRSTLAKTIPLRVLVPTIEKCYYLLADNCAGIRPLMVILSESLEHVNKSDLNAHLPQLQAFFLSALDFRSQNSQKSPQDVEMVESNVIDTLMSLVLKLTENSFRPLFYKLYDWATRSEESKDRTLTFYHVTDKIAEKLKGLFVLFVPHFLKNAADLLQQNNQSKTEDLYFGNEIKKSCQLLRYILDTLHKCFTYDREHFVNKECFNTLMQPLVDQLENLLGGDEEYKDRVGNILSPCIAQFTIAVADDSLWKHLHYQVLLKMRHSDPVVRLASLDVLSKMATKLAEDYMVLLPEAIPFLAELMEDDNFEIEERCQSVVAELEQVVGEPLTKYF